MAGLDQYLEAATRRNTQRSYQSALRHFEVEWGGHLPATPDCVARYLADQADRLAVNTLKQRLAALAHWHGEHGFADPTRAPLVRKVLKGIQTLHPHVERQAQPLQVAALTQVSDRLDNAINAGKVTASTNKVEAYNGFAKYFFFGGEGVIADNDPVEQEKAVKYNDLVSNAVIFYNVVEQTRIMKSLMRQGWKITREDVAFLSPYVTSHVKRFGDYLIDVEAIPEPYEIELALAA